MNTATTAALAHPVALQPGEIYAGLATDPLGKAVHHVILLRGDVEMPWAKARAWAAEQGGSLPTRTEALLLFHAQRAAFKRDYYWTDDQPADDPAYAWLQRFDWGSQGPWDVDDDFRARAVRRVPI